MRLFLIHTCLCVIISPMAFAQPASTAPAMSTAPVMSTAPESSTAPVMIAADQSTPRGAIKTLTIAMNKGDVAGIKSVFAAGSPLEVRMLDAVAGQKRAQAAFRDAVVANFSAEDARRLVGDFQTAEAQGLMSLETATEQINGETATVTIAQESLTLKKSGDKWTLAVPAVDATQVDAQVASFAREAKIYTDMADEIGKGRYKSADEAGKAMQLKALQQIMTHEKGTTQPSIAPTPGAQ